MSDDAIMAQYTMLYQDNCKDCTAALELLEAGGHTVYVYDVRDRETLLVVAILKQTNTLPQIFDNKNNFIGGYAELKEHLKGDLP